MKSCQNTRSLAKPSRRFLSFSRNLGLFAAAPCLTPQLESATIFYSDSNNYHTLTIISGIALSSAPLC